MYRYFASEQGDLLYRIQDHRATVHSKIDIRNCTILANRNQLWNKLIEEHLKKEEMIFLPC